jgi:DNA-binding beta-propeller fold protein YncE
MVLDRAQRRLFVTADNSDLLYTIDTKTNQIVDHVSTTAPAEFFDDGAAPKGSNPNSVTLSPDETTAYVTDSATNALAVISLTGQHAKVQGLIPTGWLPNSVSTSRDGRTLFIADGKGPAGPNPTMCSDTTNNNAGNTACDLSQKYIFQDMKANLLTIPLPDKGSRREAELDNLTRHVVENNGFNLQLPEEDAETMRFLRQHIHHVIYIVKENRTYDQILGDLPMGNGDPTLTQWGQKVTPNFHALATKFVDLDNFYCSAEVSMDGWQWSTSGRNTDTNAKTVPVNYGKGGADYDSEGDDRSDVVALATPAERHALNGNVTLDPDYLPGSTNEMAIDGPTGVQAAGYLWSNVLAAGLTFRNYGVYADMAPGVGNPFVKYPGQTGTKVSIPSDPVIGNYTDPYYYPWEMGYPDFYRYSEWAREFDGFVAARNLPSLEIMRLHRDHMGHFGNSSIDGTGTPEAEEADNDFAVALLIDKVAHSPYASDTLVFVLEDDAQDGGDHVDAHRSTAYVAGPYVKQGKVVSTYYTTVNMVRTIEEVLGLPHQNLHDGGVLPMTEVFDASKAKWTFNAKPSQYLRNTTLPINWAAYGVSTGDAAPMPTHDAAWWEEQTSGLSFAQADHVDPQLFNRILWKGLMGDKPYPTVRSGKDLRESRSELLKSAGVATEASAAPAQSTSVQ